MFRFLAYLSSCVRSLHCSLVGHALDHDNLMPVVGLGDFSVCVCRRCGSVFFVSSWACCPYSESMETYLRKRAIKNESRLHRTTQVISPKEQPEMTNSL